MPRFEPFRGLRYDLDRVEIGDVTAPPYDVIDGDDRAALAGRHPDNVVGVDLPAPTTATRTQPPPRTRRRGGTTACWSPTREPSFYVYRMDFTDEAGGAATPPASSVRSS